MRDGDGVNVIPSEVSVGKGFVNNWLDGLDVGTGGNLWDDAAIGGVDVDLRDNDVRQNFNAIFNNGGGSFVAAGLDSQNNHWRYYNIRYTQAPLLRTSSLSARLYERWPLSARRQPVRHS